MNPFQKGLVDAVYVIHVAQFTDRAAHMKEQLSRFGIPFEFVLPFDADVLDQQILARYLIPGGRLVKPQLSCILKHMEAMRRIAARNQRLALVLEDDVILHENFNEELSAILEEAKSFSPPFTIQIGCANNMYVPKAQLQPGKRLYPAGQVRATDSYLINAEAARQRLEWLDNNQFDRPAGHLFNLVDNLKKIPIYWSDPTIVVQGSMNGAFRTAIDRGRENKPLWFLKGRFWWSRLRKKYFARFF
jgi:glycosyl transferase family 25